MTLLKVATSALKAKLVQNKARVNGESDSVISAAILTCKSFVALRSALFPQVKRMIGGIGKCCSRPMFKLEMCNIY